MSIEKITKIVTYDTKEEFIFDDNTTHNGLFEAKISITPIGDKGEVRDQYYGQSYKIHLTEKTLLNAGYTRAISRGKMVENPEESMEDLFLRLLEKVGIFPQV